MPRPPVHLDAVMLEARAGFLARRSVNGEAERGGIEILVACLDLTTLEGKDTPQRIESLCARARRPAPGLRAVAAVCVYPSHVATAKAALTGSGVRVASVATAFPSGQAPLDVKLAETRAAIAAGADEIDMVIDRGRFLCGDDAAVVREIELVKAACEGAALKVILEAGELGSYVSIRRASDLALVAGADFIKTATGKIGVGSTPPIALVMCEAIRDHERRTGRAAGLKLAGGVRTAKSALGYLALVHETLGDAWMRPSRFRIGASALLDELQLRRDDERSTAEAGGVRAASE